MTQNISTIFLFTKKKQTSSFVSAEACHYVTFWTKTVDYYLNASLPVGPGRFKSSLGIITDICG